MLNCDILSQKFINIEKKNCQKFTKLVNYMKSITIEKNTELSKIFKDQKNTKLI